MRLHARFSALIAFILAGALGLGCAPSAGEAGGGTGTGGQGNAAGGSPGTGGASRPEPTSAGGATGGASAGTGGTTGTPGASGGAGGGGTESPGGSGGGAGGGGSAAEVGSETAVPADGGGEMPSAKSPGCQGGQGLPEGEATIMAANLARKYRVRLPKNYTKDKAWPLVLALHPNGNSGIGYFDGDERPVRALLAEKAVLIVPLARPLDGGFDWRGNLPADLAFFEALLTKVKAELCIDETRIFSLGFSGGGSFSGVLGCHRKDIRAIATAGAVAYYDAKDCVGTPAAWITIGQGELAANRTSFRDFWRDRNKCMTASMATEPSPCVAYNGCPSDKPVHYCQHPGGHIWPGFATKAAVDFFLKF